MKTIKAIEGSCGVLRTLGVIGVFGALGLAGCSGEHLIEPAAKTAIAFSADLQEQQAIVRSEPLETYATNFNVWGYKNMTEDAGVYDADDTKMQKVFPCYIVSWAENTAGTTNSNTHDWEYVGIGSQTTKFWDWSAKAYRFFAVTNYNGNLPLDPSDYNENEVYGAEGTYGASDEYDAYEVTMAVDAIDVSAAPYYSRLWFSTGELPTYADKQFGQPVTLEFVKPFARVRFRFTYFYPREGITLTGKSFKPDDDSEIACKGTVTISYPLNGTATSESMATATPDGVNPEALAAFTEDWDPEDDSKVYTDTDQGWYTVLPNIAQGNYTLNVNINGAARTAMVPAQYMQWQPGYQYTYIFRITEEGGVEIDLVESAFTAWTEMGISNEVYNW